MFTLQWNIENYFAPLAVMLTGEILMWFFVQNIRFDDYEKKGYADTFNRNLSLHKLSGVTDPSEGMRNLTRLLLVLDILAELYLMQTPKEYWQLTFYATPENIDYQVRFELYKKWKRDSIGPDDLLIVDNCFISKRLDEVGKAELVKTLKDSEQIIMGVAQQ